MTDLVYLDDTYRTSLPAKLLESGLDARGAFLILDRTICYPQGGGQPSDRGFIQCGGSEWSINHAEFVDGAVRHYVSVSADLPAIGENIDIKIDLEKRLRNARAHTGGHLLSHVIEIMFPELQPIKGYHFPDGPHVEFLNTNAVDVSNKAETIGARIVEEISKEKKVHARYATFEEIAKIRPKLASLIPMNKPTRIVQIGEYLPLPCGGTHVGALGELGQLRITKIKNKKENIKVSYEISAAE